MALSIKKGLGLLALAAVILGLQACGGGGGGTSDTGDDSTTYTIVGSASPSSAGTVSGGGSYTAGQTVTLTATPNAGYTFTNWTEGGTEVSESSDYTFTATANRTLVANFAIESYSIDASASPADGGSVTGVGDYDHGASVTLTATPNAGYTFTNWTEGGTEVSESSDYTFTATASRTLVANFVSGAELLNGRYDGLMKSPLAQFGADQTYTTFEVSGTDITITQEHFFGETCIFTGQIANSAVLIEASGTYQCSDFTTGTWSSSTIAKTAEDAFIAELVVDTGSGTYVAKYNGFLKNSDVPSFYSGNEAYFYDSGSYLDIAGTYKGTLKSGDTCAAYTFEVSSSDTTITIANTDIEVTQDSFYEGTCIYTGVIADTSVLPLSASGTYQCSNFDSGTWSSEGIALTGSDSFLAELTVDVPSRGCSYNVKYSGFR